MKQSDLDILRATLAASAAAHPVWNQIGKRSLPGLLAEIAKGSPVNQACGDGRTPLMISVTGKDLSLFKALLAAGADPALADRLGRTAADHACDAVASSPLRAPAKSDLALQLRDLLECHGANLDALAAGAASGRCVGKKTPRERLDEFIAKCPKPGFASKAKKPKA